MDLWLDFGDMPFIDPLPIVGTTLLSSALDHYATIHAENVKQTSGLGVRAVWACQHCHHDCFSIPAVHMVE